MNKKNLYESIMNNVAKELKKTLNESVAAPMAGELASVPVELTYDKCFMCYDENSGSLMAFGYDDLEDLCDLYGISSDDEFYLDLDEIEVGETITDRKTSVMHTRIR